MFFPRLIYAPGAFPGASCLKLYQANRPLSIDAAGREREGPAVCSKSMGILAIYWIDCGKSFRYNVEMEIISAKELSKYLKINEKMIYRLVQESKLPSIRIGGKIAFAKGLIDDWILENTQREKLILIAGSDDPMLRKIIDLFNAFQKETTVFYAPVGSMNGLKLLRERAATMSCVHILDLEEKGYTLSYLNKYLESENYVVVNLFFRDQGLYLKKGNPAGIKSIADLTAESVKFVNRNKGSGTRLLFDFLLSESGVDPLKIDGYNNEVESHLAAGNAVLLGNADASPGIRYMAHILDLDFVPFFKERFDLVISRERFLNVQTKAFLDFFNEPVLLHSLKDHEGYDMSQTGSVLNKDV